MLRTRRRRRSISPDRELLDGGSPLAGNHDIGKSADRRLLNSCELQSASGFERQGCSPRRGLLDAGPDSSSSPTSQLTVSTLPSSRSLVSTTPTPATHGVRVVRNTCRRLSWFSFRVGSHRCSRAHADTRGGIGGRFVQLRMIRVLGASIARERSAYAREPRPRCSTSRQHARAVTVPRRVRRVGAPTRVCDPGAPSLAARTGCRARRET
jgi:hypothetical protein